MIDDVFDDVKCVYKVMFVRLQTLIKVKEKVSMAVFQFNFSSNVLSF
jgi:hypothetical protein